MACAEVAIGRRGRQRGATSSCLTTTFYDLITAIQAEMDAEDDALVVATVVHLVRSGRLRWRGQARPWLEQAQYGGATHPAIGGDLPASVLPYAVPAGPRARAREGRL
jgi:hypothetical protein